MVKNAKKLDLIKIHRIEGEFHDRWAESILNVEVNYRGSFEAVTSVENKYVLSRIGKIRGKKILDLGCGLGDASLFFASRGARVYAVDISPGMINLVKQQSKKLGYAKIISAKVMAAENLVFKDDHFDFVYGYGILHHAVPDLTLQEVYRVLKPGGIAAFVEPLAHNPLINIYRRLAKKVRTPTEKPLNYSQLNGISRAKFKKEFHKEFQLFTLLIFLWYFLIERVSPNKERYWKRIVDDAPRIGKIFSVLQRIDEKLLIYFPFLKKYCWNTVLIFIK